MENEERHNPQADNPIIEQESVDACPELPPPVDHDQLELWPQSPFRAKLSELWAKIAPLWKKRHRQLRRAVLIALSACSILAILIWGFTHWTDPDRDQKLTNFIAA